MAKFNDIRELAQQNARWVSNSPKDWMNYLDVAARLYRYSFKDTLLIHAQRPNATACAELEVWNKKMNRWVNRGAKGIALLDDASPRAKLRYVFDIADTHLVQGGRTPILWRIDDSEHQQMILDHLADTYALTQTDSMNAALMELAQQLTAENLEEAMDGLEYEVADTFLEGLDEDNLRVRFRELMTNSIFYTLSRRCGQEPLEVLDDEDFIRIVDFNQLPVLTFLGNAVSEQCEAVLRDIGREMQKIYRKEVTEHLAKTADSLYNTSTGFSTLKREIETNITEGGKPYGTDLSPQGGLPVSEPDRTGQADEHWEVRDAAQDLSEGEQEELVSEYADERQAESASGADRRAGREPDGGTDREPEREVSGSEQGNRTDGMGGTPEQSDRDGGRDRAEGIGVQLTADTTEQDLSEAEEEISSAFSLPSLPTVKQQIRAIEAPMQAQYADEITIPVEVVDEILRTGSNRNKSQLRLIYNFMTEQTPEEYTAFVKKEYGEGGKGFEIGGTKYAVWFDELGMQIAVGDTVRNDPKNKAFLSWEDVSGRIHQLLQQGEYAPKSVLDAARGNVLHEHAEALSYMERDMAEGVAEMVFADTSIFSGGYPELTERLAKLLDQPEFLADLNERLLGLAEAYAEDKSVMRMQFYRPDKVSEQFQKFALPFQPYQAREGFQWNEQKVFITEDEINAFLAGGGPYSDGRLATYSFFLNHEEKAERAAFLKDRYGVGGSSHALSRADNSHANYDGRGLELARGSYGKPDALVKLNWNQAAERVAKLIDQSLYLKPADYSRMPSYEREQMANRVIGFYHRLPDEVERPFERELLNEDARKKLPVMLADSEQAAELLEKMDAALLSVPLDSPDYAEKSKILADLHQYVEGTYTIFPEKKKAIEISASETGQISLFDIWVQEQESKEHSTTAVVEEPQKQAVKYSRYIGDYLYLEDDSLYKIERVTDSLIYLKDMERPAWAARVLRPNQYDAELAKNPLNDYLLAGQESALKDSRCVYKECLYTMLDAVQQSEIYPYLRDRDVDADEAEKELRNKIDELLEQNAETAPLYLEASENWENFKDWLVEDIFQRTYQDMMPDSRDAVALYQNDIHAPRWVRGMMVDAAVQEIKTVPEKKQEEKQETPSEPKLKAYYRSTSQMEDGYVERIAILQYPNGKYYNHYGFDDVRGEGAGSAGPFDTLEDAKRTLKAHRPDAEEGLSPLSAEAENEYHALKERYPDALVGFEQNGFFEFYGDDAKRVTELIDTKMLRKETVSGEIPVTGFPREQWAHFGKELWKCGESVYLSGQGEDGTHHETKYLRREEYLPRNADVEIDGREFRVDSVDFKNRTVSLQDMTLAKEARYPIFRTEPLEYVRHLYEMGDTEYHNDIERKVFESLDKAQVAYEDFTPEQMDVIYAVAENGGSLEELLNPEFSPEQMQLIADVQTRTDAIHRSAADDAVKPLTSKPMTPEEVNQARKEKNLPLDTDTAQKPPAQPNQKPINFRITDDDLGAGGAKTKFKANIEAIRLLQTLDAEQRQATAEEQEVLSRYVGWGGIPQAFDEKNADWAKEYAELKSLLPADEYSEARASTLNAFYTSPTVIKAIYFDSWAASFGETVTAIELSPEGTGYRAKTRFARFFNLPELISLFKESADVQTADMLNLPVPEAEYINEVLKPSETQQEMVSSFADRAERVRNGNVDPRTDNMLKITNDGRKLALDQRLINDLLPDEPESKVNLCVENAYQVWKESTPDKSTQLIFCDLSTPKADGTFNVYDDVREKLVAKGIPREEIAFIHEANTETKKAELFAKVRSGQVRILLGSTPKLGAGTNIQDRLIALHHLDCPWKPSDLEQQEGRILRQGNRNQKVKIFRYVTENTFDSYMWQILENKQKFISQIMTSKSPVRACDDVDDTALTYAEIKALATGNPYIKEKMDLDIQVSKLKLMRANHTSQIYSLESDIARRYPAEITAAKERIAGLKADLAVAKPLLEQDKEKFSITVEDRVYTDRKEAGSAILAACAAMKIAKTEGQIADLGGFAISSRFDAFAQTFKLTIKRQSSYTIELGSDPAGNIQRILNALASIEKTLPQVERRLETLQQQLAEAKEEVQRPFPQEAELNEKSARLAELNALLDMDEKGDDAALGMDEEVTDSELPAPKREIERSADSVKRPSILAQLHEKQAERMAEPKPQKKKSHDMEL